MTTLRKVKKLIDLGLEFANNYIGTINPLFTLPIGFYLALSNYARQMYQEQINEYVEYLKEHKDVFLDDIVNTPKFQNLFRQLIQRYLDEIDSGKRKLILNYILNYGKGINFDFNNHTKVIRVLDLMLPEEVATFLLWKDELANYKAYSQISDEVIKNRGEFMNIRNILTRVNRQGLTLEEKDMYYIIKSLSNYGLLGVKEETKVLWGGGTTDLSIAGITRFGEDFLNYIID